MPEHLACSLNITFHFRGMGLLESLDRAADAGFRTVEMLDPYAVELDDLERELRRRGLRLSLFNLPMGDFAAGDRGIAGDPSRREDFERGVVQAAAIAERLGTHSVNVLLGRRVAGVPAGSQLTYAAERMAWAADLLSAVGVEVNTELLNPVESPGLLVPDLPSTLELVAQLDGRVGLQLDIYHLQRTHGELLPTIEATAAITRHIQVADAPARTEPGSGEINYATVFGAIEATGYAGLIGLEYAPSSPSADAFAWMDELRLVKA